MNVPIDMYGLYGGGDLLMERVLCGLIFRGGGLHFSSLGMYNVRGPKEEII